jgi:hypothetical protein
MRATENLTDVQSVLLFKDSSDRFVDTTLSLRSSELLTLYTL